MFSSSSINPQQENRGWFLVEGVIFKLGWGELVLDKFRQYSSLYLTVVQHTLVPVVHIKSNKVCRAASTVYARKPDLDQTLKSHIWIDCRSLKSEVEMKKKHSFSS